MKISYNREQDILLVEMSEEPIDHAEEMGPMIVHFTKDFRPVLLEILDASDFVSQLTKITMQAPTDEFVELSV